MCRTERLSDTETPPSHRDWLVTQLIFFSLKVLKRSESPRLFFQPCDWLRHGTVLRCLAAFGSKVLSRKSGGLGLSGEFQLAGRVRPQQIIDALRPLVVDFLCRSTKDKTRRRRLFSWEKPPNS